MTGAGTNTYLVGAAETIVIDPGPEDAGHIDRIVAEAGQIRYVVVTHTHSDHAPAARSLAERTGATVLGPPQRDGFLPDAILGDGDVVAVAGARLDVLATPGHSSDHLCFFLPADGGGVLFSGDTVLGGTPSLVAAPDGDMSTYLESLRRLLSAVPTIAAIAPGHGPLITEPRAVLEQYLAHRLAREVEVAEQLALLGPCPVLRLASAIYPDLDTDLAAAARRQLWAHLRKLANDGRAVSPAPDDPDGMWRAS